MKRVTSFNPITDRYAFDFKRCTYEKGWAQIDTKQDASYYGTWCNPDELRIVNYCEGDITIEEGESREEFVAMLRKLVAWNDEHGWGPARIDPGLNPAMKQKFIDLGVGDLLH